MRNFAYVLACALVFSAASYATTITVSGSGSQNVGLTTDYYLQTYALSSAGDYFYAYTNTAAYSSFGLDLLYTLPAAAHITSATLSFGVTNSEDSAYSGIGGYGPIDAGYYYQYTYSCGWWSTCTGTAWYSYPYSPGSISVNGYQQGWLNSLQAGADTSYVGSTNGTLDLVAAGLGSALASGDLHLNFTDYQSQGAGVTSWGYNDYTNFYAPSLGTSTADATLTIDYTVIPEPATLLLLGTSLLGLGGLIRRWTR